MARLAHYTSMSCTVRGGGGCVDPCRQQEVEDCRRERSDNSAVQLCGGGHTVTV